MDYLKLYEHITDIKEANDEGIITNALIIKNIKHMSKQFYECNLSILQKYGKACLSYYETCVWGHIYNLNKVKAEKPINEDTFRVSCEEQQLVINIFKTMISLL